MVQPFIEDVLRIQVVAVDTAVVLRVAEGPRSASLNPVLICVYLLLHCNICEVVLVLVQPSRRQHIVQLKAHLVTANGGADKELLVL